MEELVLVKAKDLKVGDYFLNGHNNFICKVLDTQETKTNGNILLITFNSEYVGEDDYLYYVDKSKDIQMIPKESLENYKVLYGH